MNEVEQLLREWCEQHPGWHFRIVDCSAEYPGFTAHNVVLENYRARFLKQAAASITEQQSGSIDIVAMRVDRASHELIRAAEGWIREHTNDDGGGCTPTRRPTS